MSHTPLYLIDYIRVNYDIKTWHIRAKTGPQNIGSYPGNILDYKEWDNEVPLRETINYCLNYGITPYVILGNEPDIEFSVNPDDPTSWDMDYKVFSYWAYSEIWNFRQRYGSSVKISLPPLSQGNFERFLVWEKQYGYNIGAYDFVAEHAYMGIPPYEWSMRYKSLNLYGDIHITEFNDNGSGRLSTTYGEFLKLYAQDDSVKSLSYFTLEGGANTRSNRPEWWFLTPEEAKKISNAFLTIEGGDSLDNSDEGVYNNDNGGEMIELPDMYAFIWTAVRDVPYYSNGDFTGIFKEWVKDVNKYGSPVSDEFEINGEIYQSFTRGVYKWSNGELVEVKL